MPLNRSDAGQAPPGSEPPVSRQAAIGLVFLLLAAAVLLFVVWLAQVQFARDYALYDVELTGQVQGLSNGGAVYLNGVRTGEVIRLALDRKDPSKVVARIRVTADTPVRRDSTAALEWMGVSGSRVIQLSGGDLSQPLLRQVTPARAIPVIHGAPGVFDSNNPEGKSVAAQALDALDVLSERLSDKNIAAIGEALDNTQATARTWRGNAKALGGMDAQLRETTRLTDALAQTAQSLNGAVNGDLHRQLDQLADTSARAKGSIARARAQIAQVRTATDGGLQALPAITARIGEAERMVGQAGEVVGRFDAPQPQLLGAPAARELKVAP